MAKTVEEYIEQNSQWKDSLLEMRAILRDTELEEEVKWGAPMYTLNGKHVVGMMGFKSYMGLWFHMGMFLKDRHRLLEQSSDETKGLRKMMFHTNEGFQKNKDLVRDYIFEAIENQKAGKEIKVNRSKELVIPGELQEALDDDASLKLAFEKLTPGKQREYADHIASAKQASTKQRRIDKISKMILDGVGLHDKYK